MMNSWRILIVGLIFVIAASIVKCSNSNVHIQKTGSRTVKPLSGRTALIFLYGFSFEGNFEKVLRAKICSSLNFQRK